MTTKFAVCGVLAALALTTATSQANMIAVFTGNTGNTFNYNLHFTVDQVGEKIESGDLITIYDVAPLASLAQVNGINGVFTPNFANLGVTPAGIGAPLVVDDPSLANVTFTYIGALPITTAQDFAVSLVTTGNYTATRRSKSAGTTSLDALSDQASVALTTVPASSGGIPEPATLGVMGLGTFALLARRKK